MCEKELNFFYNGSFYIQVYVKNILEFRSVFVILYWYVMYMLNKYVQKQDFIVRQEGNDLKICEINLYIIYIRVKFSI